MRKPIHRASRVDVLAASGSSVPGPAKEPTLREHPDDRDRFLHDLRRLSEAETLFPFPLVATATSGDRSAIVAYRKHPAGPLLGWFFDYADLDQAFDGATPEQIADAVIVGDLVDPSGAGVIRNFPLEGKLTGTNEQVSWLGLPDEAARSATRIRDPR